ncbi:hypothetical protein K2173_028448 [Erythroxylum novogranatense]|uniref:Uncharacterized protein n=1 Tax=Erythroxylum novogranatense TaxID=1862640 RepID=A0AAV8U1W3_9ROSI|nr:hypothetical protein K2173_028448 [Erythroxylum novogranatense]
MSRNKANVPFSWELKPGVSKVTHDDPEDINSQPGVSKVTHDDPEDINSLLDLWNLTIKLPTPPPRNELKKMTKVVYDDSQVPCPHPLAFQAPPRTSSHKKGIKKQEDPFLVAYMKCTQCTNVKGNYQSDRPSKAKRKKNMLSNWNPSCKDSCAVDGGSLIRISEISKPIWKGKEHGV